MLTLAIDTSTQAGSVAILREGRVVGSVSAWVEETYSSRLFRQLDFLLDELALQMQQFDLYAVAAGPGSFTGLRVGLTAVKGWAEVHNKPVAAVSALEAVAAQARSSAPLLVPVIDARRGELYGAIYKRTGNPPHEKLAREGEEFVLSPAEFLATVRAALSGREEPFAFVSPTPEILQPHLSVSEFRGQAIEQVSAVLAPVIGRLGLARAAAGELTDALHLDANYVRRSDAEVLWKGQP